MRAITAVLLLAFSLSGYAQTENNSSSPWGSQEIQNKQF